MPAWRAFGCGCAAQQTLWHLVRQLIRHAVAVRHACLSCLFHCGRVRAERRRRLRARRPTPLCRRHEGDGGLGVRVGGGDSSLRFRARWRRRRHTTHCAPLRVAAQHQRQDDDARAALYRTSRARAKGKTANMTKTGKRYGYSIFWARGAARRCHGRKKAALTGRLFSGDLARPVPPALAANLSRATRRMLLGAQHRGLDAASMVLRGISTIRTGMAGAAARIIFPRPAMRLSLCHLTLRSSARLRFAANCCLAQGKTTLLYPQHRQVAGV